MNALQVLQSSDLFSSNSDIFRYVKQKSVKINGQVVDDVNEEIEIGDFLNFTFFPGAWDLMREHGRSLLVVAKGKKERALVRVEGDICQIIF